MSNVKETLINRANETVIGERESTIWYLAAKEIGRLENKVVTLGAQVAEYQEIIKARNFAITTLHTEVADLKNLVHPTTSGQLRSQVAELKAQADHHFNMWNDQHTAALAAKEQVAELKDENAGLIAAIESIQADNDTLLDGEV